MTKRDKVFISYSHRDKDWLERLQVHLKPLEREALIERWDDTAIDAGERWHDEIQSALSSSRVAVLLVSADFLASDYIATEELPKLLKSAEAEGLVIIPIVLSPSRLETTSLSRFQSVNSPSQPLISMTEGEQEAVFLEVANIVAQLSGLKDSTEKLVVSNLKNQRRTSRQQKYGQSRKNIWGIASVVFIATLVIIWLSFSLDLSSPKSAVNVEIRNANAENSLVTEGDMLVDGNITINTNSSGQQDSK